MTLNRHILTRLVYRGLSSILIPGTAKYSEFGYTPIVEEHSGTGKLISNDSS